jgi:hypothetical protein
MPPTKYAPSQSVRLITSLHAVSGCLFIYLFSCDLFNDTDSCSDCIDWNNMMIKQCRTGKGY